jgi:tetratricopeptide (TPR) repeat protein
LLAQKQLPQARIQLAKLEQAAPGQPPTIEAKARVLNAEGKAPDAVALLREFAGSDPQKLGGVARLLEELRQFPEAEAIYRDLAQKHQADKPEAALPLAAFLGRRGRTREALDLVFDDQVWNAIRPDLATNLSVVILYGAPPGDPQLVPIAEQTAQRIQQTAAAHPDRTTILFDLANVRCLQGRFDEAEKIYRDVYRRNNTAGAPLNNLAWMLALSEKPGGSDEALRLIQQAMNLDGETPDLLDTRAVINLARNQADPAIKDLEDAIRVSPTPDKYFHLARAYFLASRHDDARAALRKAQELGLTVIGVHPMERKAFEKLLVDLARN